MIYVLLFLVFALMSLFDQIQQPKDLRLLFFLFVSFVLIAFAGMRGNIEPDYINYLDIFNHSTAQYHPSINIEYGFFQFNKLIHLLGLPFQTVVIAIAIPAILGKTYFFYRYSPSFGLSILIYFCGIFFLLDFIAIRQGLALSIFLLSIPLIYQRHFFAYVMLMVLAAQIHISALLLIPCYFLFTLKIGAKTLFTLIAICGIINILQVKIPLMDAVLNELPLPLATLAKVKIYLTQNDYSFVSIKQVFLAFAFVWMKVKNPQQNNMLHTLINIFVFGVLFATLFNGLPQLSFRMKWYFFATEAILIAYLVSYIGNSDLKTRVALLALLIISYGYSLFAFLSEIASRGDYIYPYTLFFH